MSKEQLQAERFRYVRYLWQDEVANELTGLDRLVYRSNKLGEDLTLTNTGGGNTSSKLIEQDPLTRESVRVLWVKGSGGDLRTAKRDGFASLYLDKIRAMKSLYLNDPQRGPKTSIEDAMYPMYSHCVLFRPEELAASVVEQLPNAQQMIMPGKFKTEKLVNLAKHDYSLEPNVTFTPDMKWVVFRSNMSGPTHVYAVEVAKSNQSSSR